MFKMRSIPVATTRRATLATLPSIPKSWGSLASLFVFLLAAVSTASATSVITTTTLSGALTSAPTSTVTGSQYGQSVTLTALVSGSGAAGHVNFTDGGTSITGCSASVVSSGTATCTTTTLSLGSNSLKAAFTPTSLSAFSSSSSAAQTFTVTKFQTATTLAIVQAGTTTSITTPQPYGTSVTLSATVTGAAGVGSSIGSVNFSYVAAGASVKAPTPICTGVFPNLTTGIATCTTTAPPSGANTVNAIFIPGTAFTTKYSSSDTTGSPITYTVTAASTAATLVVKSGGSPVTTEPYGTNVSLIATVSPVATGTVNFTNNGTTVTGCGAVAVLSGTATCTTTAANTLPMGANPLNAVFTPNTTNYASGSTASPTTYTVTGITPTVVLSTSSSTPAWGAPVTLTVSGLPASAGTGTGLLDALTFTYGTSATAASDITPVVCTNTVTISAGGATCITNMLPVSTSTTNATTHVTTTVGSSVVATFTPAVAADYSAATFSSNVTTVTVAKATPTVQLTTSPAGTTKTGTSVTLTATLPSAQDTGTVAFTWGATSAAATAITGCATQAVSSTASGVTTATCVTTAATVAAAATPGNYLKAVYTPTTALASNFGTITAGTANLIVGTSASSTTAVTVSAGPYYYGAPLTLTANVTVPTAVVSTGFPAAATVTFYDNGVALTGTPSYNATTGAATLSSATTLAGASLAVGTHNITAALTGTTSYSNSASSAATAITVAATPTTTTAYVFQTGSITAPTGPTVAPTGTAASPTSPSSSLANNSITLYATVVPTTASTSTAVINGGKVSFYQLSSTQASTLLGTSTISVVNGVGTASFPINCPTSSATCTGPLANGTARFIASYGGVFLGTGTAQFAGGMSETLSVVVAGTPTLKATASSPSVVYGSPVPLITPSYSISGGAPVSGDLSTDAGVTGCVTADLGNTYTCATVPSMTKAATCSITGGTAYTPTTAKGTSGITTTCSGAKDSNYTIGSSVTGTVTVTGAAPTWSGFNAQQVTYGTAITFGASVANSSVNGTVTADTGAITYIKCTTSPCTSTTTGAATVTNLSYTTLPGTYYVTATVAAQGNYAAASTTRTMIVNAATPIVTWPLPKAIVYGAKLNTSTFSTCTGKVGTTTVNGTCAWTTSIINSVSTAPSADTPDVGSLRTVTFTPNSSWNGAYSSVTAQIPVNVTPATLTVNTPPTASAVASGSSVWANGVNLSTLTSGTVKFGTTTVTGTWSWSCSIASPTTCGSINITTSTPVSATFTPNSAGGQVAADYNKVTATPSVTILATVSVFSWPTASGLTYGTPLSSSTLTGGQACTDSSSGTNCTATEVAGTFSWTSPAYGGQSAANTYPAVGTDTECVTFTAAGYAPVYSNVTAACTSFTGTDNPSVTVTAALPTSVSWGSIPTTAIYSGQDLSASHISASTSANPYATGYGGTALAGTFAWDASDNAASTAPPIGTATHKADFTPASANYLATATGQVYVTVNPCGLQDSTNHIFSVANDLNDDDVIQIPAYSLSLNITTGSDQSGICAANGNTADTTITPTVYEPSITMATTGSNPVDSTSYGTNAAVLAYGTSAIATAPSVSGGVITNTGATINITDSTGDGSGNPGTITTSGNYNSGVFASMGGNVNITNTNVNTTGNHSRALAATYQGSLNITNVTAVTTGNDSAVITTGTGSGLVTVTGGSYASSGSTSTASIDVAGTCPTTTACSPSTLSARSTPWSTIVVNEGTAGATITANNGPVVAIEGGNSVTIKGTTSNLNSLSGALGNNQGIFFYQSATKTDATPATANNPAIFSMTHGYLNYTCDAYSNAGDYTASCAAGDPSQDQNIQSTLFSVTNTTAVISLTDVTVNNITNTDPTQDGILLTAAKLSTGYATATLNLTGETLTGDVIVDSGSTVSLVLAKDSSNVPTTWTGNIANGIYPDSDGTLGTVNLTIDATSNWIVTGQSVMLNSLSATLSGDFTTFTNVLCAAANPNCVVYIANPTGNQPASFYPATSSN